MAAEKKRPDTPDIERSFHDKAEEQLARSPERSPGMEGQTPEGLIQDLLAHQVELETQAEELRRAHLALGELRDRYLDLYEFAPLGYLTVTDKALITDVNLTGAVLLGVEREKLLNVRFSKFVAEKDSNQWYRYFTGVLDKGGKQACTVTLIQGDGSTFPARLESIRIAGSDGAIAVRVAISDITDIRRVEEALKERLKELNCLYGISALLELPGISLDEILERTVLLIPPAWQFPEITEACIILEGQSFRTACFRETSWMQAREIIVNGNPAGRVVVCYLEERQLSEEGQFLKDERNLLNAIAERLGHIIERKRSEEALRGNDEKIRLLLNSAAEAIYGLDMNGNCTFCNTSCLRLLGYKYEDELLGRNMHWQIHAKHPDGTPYPIEECYIFQAFNKGEGTHVDNEVLWRADGTSFPAEYWSYPQRHNGVVVGAVVTFLDITKRKKAEEALRESNAYLNNLFDYANAPIIVWNPESEITRFNHAFEDLTGRTEEQVIGKNLDILFPPDSRDASMDLIKKAFSGEKWKIVEIPILHVISGEVKTVLWNSANIMSPDGTTVLATIAQGQDITERKELESETKFHEQELMQFSTALATANKKLNILSSITRHDINNQLTVQVGYLEILEDMPPGPARDEYFKKVSTAAERISAMIRFTKEYENIGVIAPAWQDCRTLVDTAAKEAPLGKVVVKNDLPAGAELCADPLIFKVFFNLMDNAARYGGKITTIRFSAQESGNDQVLLCEDDGDGVAAGEKEKIFDRGFGKNTGLGLAISREILDITGITIRETGVPGKGARFEITVPDGMWRIGGPGRKGD
jgi:PAS domain S-box-containing protein